MYKNKLVFEYDKYDNVETAYNKMKEVNKKKTEDLEQSIEKRVLKIRNEFDSKLVQYEDEVKIREKQSEEKIKAVEEILKQTEEDADKEILELKTKYEIELKKEKESNVKVKSCQIFFKNIIECDNFLATGRTWNFEEKTCCRSQRFGGSKAKHF